MANEKVEGVVSVKRIYHISIHTVYKRKRFFFCFGMKQIPIIRIGGVGDSYSFFSVFLFIIICFGGKDMQTLFITASGFLYKLRMNVKGVR